MNKRVISSRNNPQIRRFMRLQKRSEREASGLFYVEGRKELARALGAGYRPVSIFFCPELISDKELQELAPGTAVEWVEVSLPVFEKMAVRSQSGGVLATLQARYHDFKRLPKCDKPLYLVLEGVEKPGNIGAVYRTADAAGVDGVILCDPRADIYNPNAIRASLGCVFTVPTVITTTEEALAFLKARQVAVYSTYLEASVPYTWVDYRGATAIVAGTEATGLTRPWVEASTANIIIPMNGVADSLNISVSAAIVVFEAVRQRAL